MATISIAHLTKYLSNQDMSSSMKLDPFTVLTWSHTGILYRARPWRGQHLPWNGLSCLTVVSYVLKCCPDSDHSHVLDTIRRLDYLASDYHPENLEKEQEIAETFVNEFMPKVQKLFSFPRQNEDLAGFIHFLLQILNSESGHLQQDGGCAGYHVLHEEGLKLLQKDLSFLLAVLGDAPFQITDMEDVNDLLMQFTVFADETGSFIYHSCFFDTSPVDVNWFALGIRGLLEKVDFLEKLIKGHIIKVGEMPMSVSLMITDAPDSLYIIESLLVDLENYSSRFDLADYIKDQVHGLQEKLISARSFLKDLQNSKEKGIKELKEFSVFQIRDAAYEAEYIISSFVVGYFPDWYLAIRLFAIIQKFDTIMEAYKDVAMKFADKVLKAEQDHGTEVLSEVVLQNSVFADDGAIVGFEVEMIKILDELTGQRDALQFISIYGMAGIGKTALAKKLFNDRLIADYFAERAWCVVSQTYRKREVLIDILMSLRGMEDKGKFLSMEDHSLVTAIYRCLIGRRYLIVIDDVWDSCVWYDLRACFPDHSYRSRILFTTRVRDAVPNTSTIHTLPLLSENQSWELLETKVFRNEHCPPRLLGSGKRIASKCNGLPLALVVIAGVLASMPREESVWDDLEQSLDTYTRNCTEILELSYNHLPNHLKLCFLYFGVFPEDTEIPVRKLILLWNAEGFIQTNENQSCEHVAKGYLMDLIDRSLVSVAKHGSIGGVKACRMHDLLHDMCLKKAEEVNFLNTIENDHVSTNREHHRLCIKSTAPSYVRPLSVHCRSLFGHLADPTSCLPQMRHLRIMVLSQDFGVSFSCKIKRIDLFVHLRYLVVDQVPEPIIGTLVNLEVLRIESLNHAVYLPSVIFKMDKLKHLFVRIQAKVKPDCDISQPNNLQSLSLFSIYNPGAHRVLMHSPHLRKLKCSCHPLQIPNLDSLTHLKSLKMFVRDIFQIPRNKNPIHFPPTLNKLSLFGTRLPWEKMTVLGTLPELQALKLCDEAFEGEEWKTNDDEFLKLRFLKLDRLQVEQWTIWSEHFPSLHHLVLRECNKLVEIPMELGDIPTMQTIEVHDCSYESSISAVHIEQYQQDNGNDELKVIITSETLSREELIFKYKQLNEDPISSETPGHDESSHVSSSY